MSAHKSTTKSQVQAKKAFCKVCFDAGKDEKCYTSHFVRSEPGTKGVVVCPTLLEQECRYCFQIGHTVKFCIVLEERNKAEQKSAKEKVKQERKEIAKKKAPVVQKKMSVNMFDMLDISDEETQKKPKKVTNVKPNQVQKNDPIQVTILKAKDEFPALTSFKPIVAEKKATFSYAAVASKTADEYATEQFMKKTLEASIKRQLPPMKPISKPIVKKSWADWSDSDDEEEEMEAFEKLHMEDDTW
jgi:hypothetical protein